MKERPIIMTGNSPTAILEGRKTQTRRVIKPQPEIRGFMNNYGELAWYWRGGKSLPRAGYGANYVHTNKDALTKAMLTTCPYGQVGDRLWVRESFYNDNEMGYRVLYKADSLKANFNYGGPWKPSIHMPRWASRILLEITGIRVERLDDITEEDAIAEGVERETYGAITGWHNYVCPGCLSVSARTSFNSLWNKLNRKRGYGWETNPWVWVISFVRLK